VAGRPKRRSKKKLEESAREKRARETLQAERLEQEQMILTTMSQGRWVPGVTPLQLAKQWGVTQNVVVQLSRKASATLRSLSKMTPEFREEVLAECLQTFRTIRAFALSKASVPDERNPAPLLDVALRATRALGQYTGVEPDGRRDDDDKTHDPFSGWSRQEIEDYVSGRKARRALPEGVGEFETIGEEVDDESGEAAVH